MIFYIMIYIITVDIYLQKNDIEHIILTPSQPDFPLTP